MLVLYFYIAAMCHSQLILLNGAFDTIKIGLFKKRKSQCWRLAHLAQCCFHHHQIWEKKNLSVGIWGM
jgi:hypothetical protein